MFNNILLTVDDNHDNSREKPLPQAVGMIPGSGGAQHLMTVVPDMGTPLVESFVPVNIEKTAAAKALAKLTEIHLPDDIKINQHLKFGKRHREVLKTIDKTGADLVTIASQKLDQRCEFHVGSNADRIVRRSSVSVLVVRA